MRDLETIAAARTHFELFALPVRYTLDRQLLEQRYLELARLTHPDFAPTDPESQVRALELSARLNEARAILTDDLRRAEYLLQVRNVHPEIRRLPPELLDRIFEMREALSLAKSTEDELAQEQIRNEASAWYNQILAEFAGRLDAGDTDVETQQLIDTARYVKKIMQA